MAETIWQLIHERAEATPDDVIAVDELGRRLTFGGYRDECEAAAHTFAARGVGAGTVVSWLLPTWLESFVVLGALARLGAVQNPMLPIYRQREISFIARQARTELLVVPRSWRGTDFDTLAREALSDTDVTLLVLEDRVLPPAPPSEPPPPPDRGHDVRWLYYTSGTTGEPKGVRHTDSSILAAGRALAIGLGVQPDDRESLVFPFAHIGGVIWVAAGLLAGCTHIVVESFDEDAIDVLARERVTLAGAGTAFHRAYLERQRRQPGTPLFEHVRAFPGGAAPKPPQLHAELRDELGGVGALSSYGLTEAPILTCNRAGDPDEVLATSEGHPSVDVQLRLVDGELRVKGPQVFAGYVDPALDADAFDEDGWLRTGDLARIDEHGCVVITGRLKDVIIRKGENISAKEVEDVLYTHASVADVAVIGIPDAAVGERCCAVVVTAAGAEPLSFAAMTGHLRAAGLMVQKIPEQLEHVEVLPRNMAGKVLKNDLRARFA